MKRAGSFSKSPSSIIHHLINPGPKARETISAVFEFTLTGRFTKIFLNSENEKDQLVLQRSVESLVKPSNLSWVRGLFR